MSQTAKTLAVFTALVVGAVGLSGVSTAYGQYGQGSALPEGPEAAMPLRGQMSGPETPRPAPAKAVTPTQAPTHTKVKAQAKSQTKTQTKTQTETRAETQAADSPVGFPAQRGDIMPKACIPSALPLVDQKLQQWWGKTPLPGADEPVKRAELARVVNQLFQIDTRRGTAKNSRVPKPTDLSGDTWAMADIRTVLQYGIMSLESKNRFLPQRPIDETEALTVLAQGFGLYPMPDQDVEYWLGGIKNRKDLPQWSHKGLATAIQSGWLGKARQQPLEPTWVVDDTKSMTWGEFKALLGRILWQQEGPLPCTPKPQSPVAHKPAPKPE